MPFLNDRQHPGRAWRLLLPTVVAVLAAPATAVAAESVPRACDDMSFKVIAQMMDTASNFETRLVLLGNSLTQDKSSKN